MNHKRWISTVFLIVLINMSLLAMVNYVIDPFYVLQSNFLTKKIQMNERFAKVKYLQKNHQKYNAYLFGSSRIGVIEPKVFEQYIPHSKFYNFTLSSANLYDYEKHLAYFIKNNYEINTLVLQLDIDNMNDYGQDSSDYLSLLHPDVMNGSLLFYYARYLLGFFPLNIRTKIEMNLQEKIIKPYALTTTGSWKLPYKERALRKDSQKYVKKEKSFAQHNRRVIFYNKQQEDRKALKNIIKLCKNNAIKLYLFTTPHNKNMMDSFVLEDYYRYLNDIALLTSFYDFSGYNSITNNNENYYETSHYRPFVGELIAGKIFHSSKIVVPNDFGIYRRKGEKVD